MAKGYEEPVGGLHNVLAVGTTLKGTIETESDFRLDGRVEGEIFCKGKIVIGPKGSVNGNIRTVNAEIFGRMEGTIHASENLVLKAGADLKGDIFIQTLEIEPGVKLNGSCTMAGKEGAASQPVQQAVNQQKPTGK